MVPVPVSLIERLLGNRTTDTLNELRALLSQPTPSAEHEVGCHACLNRDDAQCNCRAPAAPPSIADMAPGTTFVGETSETRYLSRWTVLASGRIMSGMGIPHDPSEIDPSTIRDVALPETD
jgi:hypothetical protein